MKKLHLLISGGLAFLLFMPAFAQKKAKTTIGADIVSNYVWRGVPGYAPLQGQNLLAPSIQPTLAWTYGNLEIGAWGSGDFTGTYKEVDLYAGYTFKSLTLTFTDYYWNLDWLNNNYFDYDDETTSHIFEGSLEFAPENLPFSVLLASMFYGADKKAEDPAKANMSTYVELIYRLPAGDDELELSLGMTPSDGFYGDGYGGREGFAVVNAGISGKRSFKINDKLELPLKAALITNPQQEKIYLTFTLSL
ncbi:MAG TPA: hypothetical protein P5531_03420 [Bacteroidales bacterium]|nr:hypothetical protein [Bacteroidales bacterium]HSA42430.1 hypothetical protein [Bacteroidales bacterium]